MDHRFSVKVLVGVLALSSVACGDDEGKKKQEPCKPGAVDDGCKDGLVCEELSSGEPACVAPFVVRGRVLDTTTGDGIEGAEVVALDINGSARGSVSESDEDGAYELVLSVARDESGAPVTDDSVTLYVAAAGYQSFPTWPRQALPIELSASSAEGADAGEPAVWIVMNAATDVGLVPLPGDSAQLAIIEGSIDHAQGSGALVVAVQGGKAVSTAIAASDGGFTLFNVPAAETSVEGYRAGLVITPASVTPAAGQVVSDVVLAATDTGLVNVSGSVNIVNAEGGLKTSVILALESTFVENGATARGVAPLGLRATDVSGAFSIADVPPGKYAVLAAFENDRLVRDPDQGISGTDVVHIDVTTGGGDVELSESFKVTEALAVHKPGAEQLELVAANVDPTFEWADDSSEDGYELRVYDSFGELVHQALNIAGVSGGGKVSYTWSGATLSAGSIYQFRVLSFREGKGGAGAGMRTYISATEDLRGVFQAQ